MHNMKPRFQQTNVPHLVKDNTSGACINTDIKAFEAYKAKRANRHQAMNRMDIIESRVNELSVVIKDNSAQLEKIAILLQHIEQRNGR